MGAKLIRNTLLFGASGRLGSAILSRFSSEGHKVITVSWDEAQSWLQHANDSAIQERIVSALGPNGTDIIFANGNTDPSGSAERLIVDNYEFPRRVIEATDRLQNVCYLTLGTVLERVDGIANSNPYAASKKLLGDWLQDAASDSLAGRVCHLRLHTLYGGHSPSPHMFLGQMVSAVQAKRPFAMSEGSQLREYHHMDDVAGAIKRLLDQEHIEQPVMTLSSGSPIHLVDLAQAVFNLVGRPSDLEVGALMASDFENFSQIFEPSPAWLLDPSRPPLSGVSAWVRELLEAPISQGPQLGVTGAAAAGQRRFERTEI